MILVHVYAQYESISLCCVNGISSILRMNAYEAEFLERYLNSDQNCGVISTRNAVCGLIQ